MCNMVSSHVLNLKYLRSGKTSAWTHSWEDSVPYVDHTLITSTTAQGNTPSVAKGMHTCAETNFINVFLVRMCLKLCVIYFFLLLLTPPVATIPHNWTDPRNLHPCLCTLRPWKNGRNFADDIFKCIFLNENAWISFKISLKFVPKVRINNIPALV